MSAVLRGFPIGAKISNFLDFRSSINAPTHRTVYFIESIDLEVVKNGALTEKIVTPSLSLPAYNATKLTFQLRYASRRIIDCILIRYALLNIFRVPAENLFGRNSLVKRINNCKAVRFFMRGR